ncbi:MAG: flavodoxin family protein [Oscillospiraceae bacterium]|nr:flavodoxin family protein [Oscillospiraceae bacterium]
MKTLLINGSPRPNGNTVALIRELKAHLEGEIVEISAFYSGIAPCIDCRGCWKTAQCVIHDGMDVIYEDDFDNVVIASPVYYGTLPGSVLSLMSRLQPWHVATHFLKKPLTQKPKKAAAILTAGGKGNAEKAHMHLNAFFRMLNARGFREHTACSPDTDTIPADRDDNAKKQAAEIARWLNSSESPPEFTGFQACGYRKEQEEP